MTRDWVAWHTSYEDPASSLSQRLRTVQARLSTALDSVPPGPVRVLSMCAGQGRDLLEVLATHPRAGDVSALLVELDPSNAAVARSLAPPGVSVVCGDAGVSGAYADIVPVDIALVCGVFGNISQDDIRHTVECLPMFLRPEATVIWTRGFHREPDVPAKVRQWFVDNGFTEIAFDTVPGRSFGVGTNRLAVPPAPYRPDVQLFQFRAD